MSAQGHVKTLYDNAKVHRDYILSYEFPSFFWDWAIKSACSPWTDRQTVDEQTHKVSEYVVAQLAGRLRLHREDPALCLDPFEWVKTFVGGTKAELQALRRAEKGIASFSVLSKLLQAEASKQFSEYIKEVVSGLYIPTPPQNWPPNHNTLFPLVHIPLDRPTLNLSVEQDKQSWSKDPSVQAAEWIVIGYLGKVLITAIKKHEVEIRRISRA